METQIRIPTEGDLSELRHIWETVFGTPDDKLFFEHLYDAKLSAVAIADSQVAASAYLIPCGIIESKEGSVPCAMIYGVAALPEYRGRGYGTAVVQYLISTGREAGYPAIVLCPAQDSLFGYYSARTELREWFYINEQRYEKPQGGAKRVNLAEISAAEYTLLRNSRLSDVPHINMDLRAITYQSILCREFGGGLFRADSGEGVSCAAVETTEGDSVYVKELLGPESCNADVISAIAEKFTANEYYIRTPHYITDSIVPKSTRRFAMLAAPASFFDADGMSKTPPWYGMAFD